MKMGMNPEFMAMNSLDKQTRADNIKQTTELLLPLHPKIEAYMNAQAIKPEDFSDIYGQQSIDKDRHYVTERKRQFAETATEMGPNGLTNGDIKKLADISEYLIYTGINNKHWLPGVTSEITAPSDEIGEGIDQVLIYDNGSDTSHLGLGVDISFSHNLMSKFKRIKDEIDNYDGVNNVLGRVKYFRSGAEGEIIGLKGLTRVVVAFDLGVMEDMIRLKNQKDHIARHAMVMEMERQLAVFADYAHKINAHPECVDSIMKSQNLIHQMSIVMGSEHRLETSEYVKNRKMDKAIDVGLALFK